MASSYVNNLRLNEMATGDASGTWGTVTNTNLELIGEALGFGTEAITTNADTHTTTVADGASDGGRAMYLKYTGTLDSACTITIAPDTMKRLQFIENGTSGSQNIIISQGSGANVTIPPGDTKAVYLDGAGSGAAVVDAFASLNVVDLKVEDDLTVTDDASIGGALTVTGIMKTDDATDATSTTDGSLQTDGGLSVAKDAIIGNDLKLLSDSAVLVFGAGSDATLTHTNDTGLTLNSTNKLMFNDASQFIQGSSATVLSLGATDEIDLTATAIDVNGTMDVSGAITSSAGMTITTADNSNNLTLISTDADASTGPNLVLQRDSGSPADNDLAGTIKFIADNDAGQATDLVSVYSKIIDASDGTEDASLLVNSIVGGSQVSRFNITPTEIALNDDSIDLDFRVEGNGDANALFVRGSDDKVGIGTNSPNSKLSISEGGNTGGLLELDETDAANLAGYMQFDSNGTNKANIQNANNAGIHICVGTGGSVTFTALGYTAANALDDYEEGTWTPTLRGESGTEPTQGTTASAKYVKVGQLVHIEARMVITTDNGGSGLEVVGFPFVSDSAVIFHLAETAVFGVIGIMFSNGSIAAGSGIVTFREGNGTGAWQSGTYVQRGNGQYTIVGTYRTTS
jgi:hypothetical protein